MRVFLAALAILMMTNPGRGENFLRPGFSVQWKVAQLSEGHLSEETLSIAVQESVGVDSLLLTIRRGNDDRDYRILYWAAGDEFHCARERILSAEIGEGDKRRGLLEEELFFLDQLEMMELRIGEEGEFIGDTLLSLAGRSIPCRRLRMEDEGEDVQDGESVVLRTYWNLTAEAWVSDALPLGWLFYREDIHSRKVSEFGGREFEGEDNRSISTWEIQSLQLP
ncbi:MAG: hypothetical protein QGG80_04400 [Candidatus Krumholzibacteria bacterium]|jgi:hypothetical protein|nr:hypothetical protein [Candidatus Krumholzibacteria bacterium]